MRLKRAEVDQPISAAAYNAVLDVVEQLQDEVAALRTGSDGEQEFDRPLRAKVISRVGVGSDGTGLEPDIFYDLRVKGLDRVVEHVQPTKGRPARANGSAVPRLIAANVNDVCFVVRRRNPDGTAAPSEYWIDEQIAIARCSEAGGSLSGSGLMREQQRRANEIAADRAGGGSAVSAGGGSTGGGIGA